MIILFNQLNSLKYKIKTFNYKTSKNLEDKYEGLKIR